MQAYTAIKLGLVVPANKSKLEINVRSCYHLKMVFNLLQDWLYFRRTLELSFEKRQEMMD